MENVESLDQLYALVTEFGLKFLVAVLCGGAIGLERETSGKAAGLRTNMIICIGSMLFTVMSFKMAGGYGGDGTRIAAQIISGVGFLGAGVILHEGGGSVRGMTTAAIIWLVAALGVMIGAGYLISATAVTFAIVGLTFGLRRFERYINERRSREYRFAIPDAQSIRARMTELLGIYDEHVQRITIDKDEGSDSEAMVSFRYAGPNDERRELLERIYQIEGARLVSKS